ncbi:MAG: molybdopterin-binding protein [Verrucomicrobia bacterium]|nr:molybdopterin-binding protein [Verrucomicrobiota bacterium]
MPARFRLALFLATAALLTAAEPLLSVHTPEKTVIFTTAEFAALPHQSITAIDPHSHVERHFAGVAVREILTRAGAPLGEKLRGPALRAAVIARASDGYIVVFALAEFDEAFSSRTLFLADAEDGKPLLPNSGPLKLIAPGDKKAARWARQITSLEVVFLGEARPAKKS